MIEFILELILLAILSYLGSVQIAHNFAKFDASGFSVGLIDSSANVSLYGNPGEGFVNHVILKNGLVCGDCVAYTPLSAEIVKFGVSGQEECSIGCG